MSRRRPSKEEEWSGGEMEMENCWAGSGEKRRRRMENGKGKMGKGKRRMGTSGVGARS
jgi:hypothetical protein